MLQIHKPLSRKLWIYSTIALIGVGGPALVYGMSITPEYVKAAGTALKDIATMQEMTKAICSDSEIGDTATLTDMRDGFTYTVRKHEDSNCWMTQNLRLTKEGMDAKNTTLTNENSDITGTPVFTALPASDSKGFSTFNVANVYYDSSNPTYGAYYTWYAATAGTGTRAVGGGDVNSSICSKGWKLPSQSDYASLMAAIGASYSSAGSALIRNNTYKFQYAGNANNGSLGSAGSLGYYWSRTEHPLTNYAYSLYIEGSRLTSLSQSIKYSGFPIRCVAYGEPREVDGKINVSVAPTITIDATSGMNSEVEASTVATGNITARISSNTAYKVLLNASTTNPGNKTSLYRRTDDMQEGTTPTYDTTGENIPATSTVEANKNGWGISNSCNQDGSNLAYLPITTVEKEYCGSSKESATYDEATQQYTHAFGIGISVSPSLSSGTYETSITVTGMAN